MSQRFVSIYDNFNPKYLTFNVGYPAFDIQYLSPIQHFTNGPKDFYQFMTIELNVKILHFIEHICGIFKVILYDY